MQRYTLMAADAAIQREAADCIQHLPAFCSELLIIANAYLIEGRTHHPDQPDNLRLKMYMQSLVALVLLKACAAPSTLFKGGRDVDRILQLDALKNEYLSRLDYKQSLLEPRNFPFKDTEELVQHRLAAADVSKYGSEQGLTPEEINKYADYYCGRAYIMGKLPGFDKETNRVTESSKKHSLLKFNLKRKSKSELQLFDLGEVHDRIALPFLYVLNGIQIDSEEELKRFAKTDGKRMLLACLTNEKVPSQEPLLRTTL